MKINMPVTNKEVLMQKGDILVTRTDLKGTITYANDAFVEISGYSRKELIGANHDICRHPDMPEAVFEDLWASLKQNKPWTAPIKNRTKSGDYYWAEANVIPIFKNGVVQEYMSVRYIPKPDHIKRAEQHYKQLNAKTATMRPTGVAAIVKSIKETAIWKKAAFSMLILAGLVLLLGYRLFLSGEYGLLASVGVLATMALTVNTFLFRSFDTVLEYSVGVMYRLAEEQFRNTFDLSRKDQIGDFYRGIYAMQVRLNYHLAESRQIAAEALQRNEALNNVSSGIMMTDQDLTIIYTNKFVQDLFASREHEIRKQLPNFDASKLLGSNIDIFHKDPAFQRKLLAGLTEAVHSELTIANLHLTVVVSPVISEDGRHVGYVTEWLDRTAEVKVEQEITHVVAAAGQGDFTQRITEQGKKGVILALSQNINRLIETSETGLNEVVRVLDALSRGDLTETITNDYFGTFGRLKDDANTTVEKLKGIISKIKEVTDNINTGAKEIASGNNDLSHRTEQQAASLEETAASMEELTSTVQHNAESAKQANQLAVCASDVAGKGVEVVGQVVKTMDEINTSSRKIGDIISVIDDIAFQTNILALNAAVEAARAGEQGRGFAVVAVEVRNLAQRAAAAAGEIKHLIDDSVSKVSDGSKLVAKAGQTMTEIVNSIHGVTVMMSEISDASAEQTAGIQQVNQAIGQMDDVTQQNAALVEQAAAAAESLEEQAQILSSTVGQFKVDAYSHTERSKVTQKPASSFRAPAHKESSLARTVAPKNVTKSKPIPQSTNDEWEEF